MLLEQQDQLRAERELACENAQESREQWRDVVRTLQALASRPTDPSPAPSEKLLEKLLNEIKETRFLALVILLQNLARE